jgi:uncharacterized protein (TIRG00374 family)
MKLLRLLGILFGAALVFLLLRQVGITPVLITLRLLGWGYLIVLVYPITWMLCNTMGWRMACHPESLRVGIGKLLAIRLAGETFNSLLPSGYVGGEPVKAKLLSQSMPLREATSSVLIAKAAQSIGLLLFIGLGLTIGLPPTATAAQKEKAWLALAALTVGVGIFTVLLANRSFTRAGRVLFRLTGLRWLAAQERRLVALDESLGTFYRDCKGRFLASALWHGAGWIAGMFELVVIFTLMENPISWRQAWFMGALAQLGSVIGLISPGGVGFYEGGHYMAAVLLGLPPSLGLSASLIRRVREIFWDVVGLYFFSRYSKTSA